MSTSGDIMMHVGDTINTLGVGDIMSTSRDLGFSIEIERFSQTCCPKCENDIPQCTEHP